MKFIWEQIRGSWETALPVFNQRLKQLQYVLHGFSRVDRFLLLEDALLLRKTLVLKAQDTTPAVPDADHALLYVRDNGAGKMQLVIRYPGGSEAVLHTEV